MTVKLAGTDDYRARQEPTRPSKPMLRHQSIEPELDCSPGEISTIILYYQGREHGAHTCGNPADVSIPGPVDTIDVVLTTPFALRAAFNIVVINTNGTVECNIQKQIFDQVQGAYRISCALVARSGLHYIFLADRFGCQSQRCEFIVS